MKQTTGISQLAIRRRQNDVRSDAAVSMKRILSIVTQRIESTKSKLERLALADHSVGAREALRINPFADARGGDLHVGTGVRIGAQRVCGVPIREPDVGAIHPGPLRSGRVVREANSDKGVRRLRIQHKG